MKATLLKVTAAVTVTAAHLAFAGPAHSQVPDRDAALLGTVSFETSAAGEAQELFVGGVLALHSFWYSEARERFLAAQRVDPAFGMAYWGEAMTYDNALRTEPDADALEALGAEIVAKIDSLNAAGRLRWTPRERAYANAVRERFTTNLAYADRRQSYAREMEELARAYPEDDEAVVFAALALMALPSFDREQTLHIITVAAPLEDVYERNRDHPGALHYLIHVYDNPLFARMALRQARRYAEIAPASSHALHMPSHIFRQLEMWEEVADLNERAYAASVAWQERTDRPLAERDFHALDWLLDAYIRLGRSNDAQGVIDELDAVEAEMERRGEVPGHVASLAKTMRAYFGSTVR